MLSGNVNVLNLYIHSLPSMDKTSAGAFFRNQAQAFAIVIIASFGCVLASLDRYYTICSNRVSFILSSIFSPIA